MGIKKRAKFLPGAPGVLTIERQGKMMYLTFEMN